MAMKPCRNCKRKDTLNVEGLCAKCAAKKKGGK